MCVTFTRKFHDFISYQNLNEYIRRLFLYLVKYLLLEMGKKYQKANQPDKRIKPRSCDDKIDPSFVKKNLVNLKFIDKACSNTFQDLNTAILHINKIHHIPHPFTNIQCKFCKKISIFL